MDKAMKIYGEEMSREMSRPIILALERENVDCVTRAHEPRWICSELDKAELVITLDGHVQPLRISQAYLMHTPYNQILEFLISELGESARDLCKAALDSAGVFPALKGFQTPRPETSRPGSIKAADEIIARLRQENEELEEKVKAQAQELKNIERNRNASINYLVAFRDKLWSKLQEERETVRKLEAELRKHEPPRTHLEKQWPGME